MKWRLPKRVYDAAKRFESKRKGWSTYIDRGGNVKAAVNIREGQSMVIPPEHYVRMKSK